VGISTMLEPERFSADRIEDEFDTNVPKGTYSVGYIDPLTTESAQELTNDLAAQSSC
jgi:hypothetical protein